MKNRFIPSIPAIVGAVAVPASAGLVHASGEPAAGKHPNIIYIMTDQQCATAMSCAGNRWLRTPNMDRLAEHGIRYTEAYCAMPLSGPSRAAMFTGYMPSESGVMENGMPLPDSLKHNTLGTLIKDAGYDCAYAGKWHVNTISLPAEEAFGFKRIAMNGDSGLAEACVNYMRNRQGDKPFFLIASYINPHNICEFARNQDTPNADIGVQPLGECPNLPANFAVNPYDASILAYEKSLSYSLYPCRDFTPDDWRRYRSAYYRLVEAVDSEIGKIVDEIDRQNLWQNTVIIFTSDHGDGNAAHQWNQKTALYEEVVNVPFIICLPGGHNAGQVRRQLINTGIDLMPSICDWAGAGVPSGRHGDSFRQMAESSDENIEGQRYVVSETNFRQTSGTLGWMVRTKQYKYVLYDKGKYREQLYDMTCDRGEMRNLAVESAYKEILQQHRDMLREWMEEHPSLEQDRNFRFIPKAE